MVTYRKVLAGAWIRTGIANYWSLSIIYLLHGRYERSKQLRSAGQMDSRPLWLTEWASFFLNCVHYWQSPYSQFRCFMDHLSCGKRTYERDVQHAWISPWSWWFINPMRSTITSRGVTGVMRICRTVGIISSDGYLDPKDVESSGGTSVVERFLYIVRLWSLKY